MTTATFSSSFLSSFSLILASELGDKTFFITSIMAIKYAMWPVFFASMSAMTIMNIFSICLGILTKNINPMLIQYISILLFFICGVRMMLEGVQMSEEESLNEYNEAKKLLEEKQSNHIKNNNNNSTTTTTTQTKSDQKTTFADRLLGKHQSAIYLQVFSLIFFAEWGDKSQLSTILLAAKEGYGAVGLGSFFGFLVCNGIAVVGSQAITKIISVKFVTIIGGLIFIACSVVKFCTTL